MNDRARGRRSISGSFRVGLTWLAAAHFGLAVAALPDPDQELLSDADGTMEHVVCVVNSARRALLHNSELVTRILNALPDRIRVTLLTNDREAFTLPRERSPGRVRFVHLPREADFTIWPQDPFLVLNGAAGTSILQSANFPRADDDRLTASLCSALGWQPRPSPLAFQGGNLVANARHVFVGADTIRLNALRLGVSDEATVRRLERELGKPVLVLGPVPQPVGHIDLVVTPLGQGLVVVADARWGVRLARQLMAEDNAAAREFERSIGERFNAWRSRSGPKTFASPLRPPSFDDAVAASEGLAPHLDGLADGLTAHGSVVRRVPFLGSPVVAQEASSVARAGGELPVRLPGFPCLTYGNVLVEEVGEERVVYLPQYGWTGMDAAGRAAWEALGCSVVPVTGLLDSAMHGGSLRCCVKVLRRRRETEPPVQ